MYGHRLVGFNTIGTKLNAAHAIPRSWLKKEFSTFTGDPVTLLGNPPH